MSDTPKIKTAPAADVLPTNTGPIRDDWGYMLPMFAFLGFVWLGSKSLDWYPLTYVGRCIVVAILLIALRKCFTKITWDGWWLGLIVGVIGLFQWVGMQLALQHFFPIVFTPDIEKCFNPVKFFGENHALMYAFIAVRWVIGASIIVPIMEELFWRDFAWRNIIAPNDFKLAKVGEWDWKAFVGVALIFAVVHGAWWLTSIVWALMIGLLLLRTRSIGACIIAHATTNFLLGAYVLYTQDWRFW